MELEIINECYIKIKNEKVIINIDIMIQFAIMEKR